MLFLLILGDLPKGNVHYEKGLNFIRMQTSFA